MGLYYNGNDIGVIMPIWKKKNLPDLNFFDIKRNVYIYIINSTIEKLRCMMERYIIKGGTPLVGEVEISGAKNAALGILAAAIMADETVAIDNLPDVSDVNVLIDAIAEVGAKVNRDSRHSVKINGGTITSTKADNEYIKKIRASYYLLGAFLGKFKKAEVP
jgi:hypothetical protein